MKNKLWVSTLLLIFLSFSASAQLEIGSLKHDMNPLTPTKEHKINVPIENTGLVPQSTKFTLSAQSKINTSYEDSIFDVSGDLGGSTFDSCSFSYENAYVYSCPSDGRLQVDSDFDHNLTLYVKAPLGIRGGSDLLSLNLTAESRTGKMEEKASVDGEAEAKEVGKFSFDVSGSDASGKIASMKSLIFDEASESELLGRFATDIEAQDSVEFTYDFSESLIKHYDYTFKLYNYSDGSWENIDVNVNKDSNSVSSEISGSGYYSLYIDRQKMSIQDLVERETNVTKNVSGGTGHVELEKLGQTENLSVSLPTLLPKNRVKVNGFEIMSKVNDSASFSVEMLEDLPAGTSGVNDEDFNSTGFAKIEADGNDTLKFKSYSFQMNPDLFNYSENVAGYRFNGDAWVKMETNLLSSVGSYYTFKSATDGNSILAFGHYKPKIKLGELAHREKLLDNETLRLKIPVKNEWRGKGEITINYTLNGSDSNQKTIEVEGEGKKTVEFKESSLEPGNYTITVNDRESEFEVQLRDLKWRILDRLPFNNLMMLYALIGFLLALPIILIGYREREEIKTYSELVFIKMKSLLSKLRLILGSNSGVEDNISDSDKLDSSREDTDDGVVNSNKVSAETSVDGKTLKCDECGRVFNSKEGLKMHRSKDHGGRYEEGGDYECALCEERFDTSTGLELHHEKFHEND